MNRKRHIRRGQVVRSRTWPSSAFNSTVIGLPFRIWLNLQSHYDLEQGQQRLARRLEKEVKVLAAA